MVGDAMGAILWVMPFSGSQTPMARAPTLPPIAYGAVLAGTGTWRLIHVRHEVDKVVRVGVVVGVGLRVVLRVHVHLRRVAIGHRSDVSRTAWKRAMLAPLPTQILRSTRDPWNIPVRIIFVHEQDEIDLKRMRSDVMSESPHKSGRARAHVRGREGYLGTCARGGEQTSFGIGARPTARSFS